MEGELVETNLSTMYRKVAGTNVLRASEDSPQIPTDIDAEGPSSVTNSPRDVQAKEVEEHEEGGTRRGVSQVA
jgi:hypothetical protein